MASTSGNALARWSMWRQAGSSRTMFRDSPIAPTSSLGPARRGDRPCLTVLAEFRAGPSIRHGGHVAPLPARRISGMAHRRPSGSFRPLRAAALLGACATASAVLYLTKQEPAPDQPRYIRDRGALGIGVRRRRARDRGNRALAAVSGACRGRPLRAAQPYVVGASRASVTAERSFVGAVGTF
jgi:hypothetical protein